METEFERRAQIALPELFGPLGALARTLSSNGGSLRDPLPFVPSRLNKLRPWDLWTSLGGEAPIALSAVNHQSAQGLFPQSGVPWRSSRGDHLG